MTEQNSKTHGTDPEIERSYAPSDVEVDTDAEPEIPASVGRGRKRKFLFIGAFVLLVLILGGVGYWVYARQFESTDDAFIDGDIVQISPKVSAYVAKVDVASNQFVHKGDLLVELNPQDLELRLEQAKAQLENARAQYNASIANVTLTKATTSAAQQAAQANLNAANRAVDAAQSRIDEAQANVAAAQDTYRQSVAAINTAQSQVGESQGRLTDANAAPERVAVSQSSTETAQAQIAAAEAAVHQAEQDLSYSRIYAPEDGFVTRKTVEEGQLVQVGTPLMAISQSDEIWVVGNLKETQLENMRIGQKVDIGVDAYPGKTFHGHVESFQVGTGSRFSLLPAENATGNFVKVVQRIPVKIVFDERPEDVHLLAPGMSAEPTVKVR
jgi:membrane fusion protein (multidrug efflux system)